jgi:hypothetical protein
LVERSLQNQAKALSDNKKKTERGTNAFLHMKKFNIAKFEEEFAKG